MRKTVLGCALGLLSTGCRVVVESVAGCTRVALVTLCAAFSSI